MAVRIQVPKKAALVRFALHPWGRALLIIFFLFNTVALVAFTFYHARYAKLIEKKLVTGPLAFFFYALCARVTMELVLAIFSIEAEVKRLNEKR